MKSLGESKGSEKSEKKVKGVLIVIPTREGPRIGLESTPFPDVIGFESNLDTIH